MPKETVINYEERKGLKFVTRSLFGLGGRALYYYFPIKLLGFNS
ncbi:hypothetical protein UF75_2299 [Desulfosporosinus sp. I2]|nr:hypothetical protein UF75_2299 [Desulfosporosinus sp. I2]